MFGESHCDAQVSQPGKLWSQNRKKYLLKKEESAEGRRRKVRISISWCRKGWESAYAQGQGIFDMGNSDQLGGKITMRSWSNIEAGAQTLGSSRMEIFKTSLDMFLSSLMQLNLLWKGGWTGWPPEEPSNHDFIIIWQFKTGKAGQNLYTRRETRQW